MQENKQEKSPIKQRILQYLGKKGISMYDCYAKTGITRGILGQNNGISEDNITRFLAYYTEINVEWLVLGHGSMIRDNEISEEIKLGIAPAMSPIPIVEESIIYKMYEKKDEEVKVLIRENGHLEERIRTLESKLKECKAASETPEETPVVLDSAKNASIKKRSSLIKPSAASAVAPLKDL